MQVEFAPVGTAVRKVRRDPANHLLDAMQALAEQQAIVLRHDERAWASITFSGARHTVALRFAGEAGVAAGERFIAALSEHEFAIPRQLVADAAVVAARHALLPQPSLEVECEVLLLDED